MAQVKGVFCPYDKIQRRKLSVKPLMMSRNNSHSPIHHKPRQSTSSFLDGVSLVPMSTLHDIDIKSNSLINSFNANIIR